MCFLGALQGERRGVEQGILQSEKWGRDFALPLKVSEPHRIQILQIRHRTEHLGSGTHSVGFSPNIQMNSISFQFDQFCQSLKQFGTFHWIFFTANLLA